MKKLFTFLTLLMLFLGSGTSWAGFNYDWGSSTGTWDFTTGVTISDFTNSGWTAGNGTNPSRAYKVFNGYQQASGPSNWGFDHLMFDGTITIYNTGQGLHLPPGASIGINVYPGYTVSITATTHQSTANGDRGNPTNCTWENVVDAPQNPCFDATSKTVDVIYNGTNNGYVKLTNNAGQTNYRDLFITKIVMSPKPTMYWKKNDEQLFFDKIDFTQLDYTEPTLVMQNIPSNATIDLYPNNWNNPDGVVTVRTSNYSDGNLSFDLMALKPGTSTVTAIAKLYGNEIARASYTVTVDIDEYQWETEGTYKFKLTGAGAITNPVVDAVPYMTMTFGNPSNVGMVRDLNDNLVATIIDQYGWRHARLYDGTNGGALGQPWQGTFYKFQPQIDGELTIWMRLASGKAVIVEEGNWSTAKIMYTSKGSGIDQYEKINLQGGHTYYLYGIVQEGYVPSNFRENYGDTWACAELSAFKFEPVGGLIYAYKGLVYKGGKLYDINGNLVYNEPRQKIGGPAERVEYSLEFYPNATDGPSASIADDGTLTIDETKGGAIAVKAIVRNGQGVELNRDYYIVTVPYTTHDWWFTESVNPKELVEDRPAQGKQDFTTWGLAYKVLRPVIRNVNINGQSQSLRLRKEVKAPVLCSSKAIQGNNAGYAVQTAGLLFNAQAQRFGVNTDMDYSDIKEYENGHVKTDINGNEIYLYDFDGNDQDAITLDGLIGNYAYNKTPQDTYNYPTSLVTMATYSTLIIPNLQKGQHIRIYWARHNVSKGDKYTATGVTDLEGTPITGEFYIGNGNGYTEFIAKGGNATFTLNDNNENTCWTNIYRITVGEVGEFLETTFNNRVGNIAYNPRPNIPLVAEDAEGNVHYLDYHGQNYATDYPGYTDKGHWGPIAQYNMPYETFVQDGTGSSELEVKSAGSTSSLSVSFEIPTGMNVGNGTATIVDNNKLQLSGNGIVAIVCKGSTNGYVLDIDTLTMAYGTVDIQTYPHTWDFTKIGINTDTPDMLAQAFEDGTGINWYKKNETVGVKDESDYKLWQPATDVEGEWILNGYHKDIKATVFPQGSQLTAGYNPIEETQGLGIYLRKGTSGSYFIYSMADDKESSFSGNDMLRYGTADGQGYLRFPATPDNRSCIIRVPAVSKTKGERVYICADGTPTVYQEAYANNGAGSNSTITELPANTDGNNSYFVPENDGDVFIDVTDMKVFKIGVTSTLKKLTDYQGKSYATESRHHNERYDLSGYFTGNDVKAYKVLGYRKSGFHDQIEDEEMGGMTTLAGRLNLEEVEVAPDATGVILVGQGTGFTEEPLFVKDVNTDLSDMAGNYMTPSYTYNADGSANAATVPNDPYILAMKYTPVDANGNPTGPKKDGPLAFYKMTSGQLKANLAYFSMPETTPVTKTTTYALKAGDTFTAGQSVEVKEGSSRAATITYGVSGGAGFAAAQSNSKVQGFTAFTAGNGQNGTATSGTVYSIKAEYDGTMEVAVVLNDGKPFYILENGTALEGYDGMTVTEKYYGTYSFPVKGGKTYKVYCTGSKLGFYGFNYTYTVEEAGTAANYFVFWFIDDENGEDDLDAIEQALEEQMPDGILSDDAVYYNLNGQKLPGKPSQRGIYICNGKKIFVK